MLAEGTPDGPVSESADDLQNYIQSNQAQMPTKDTNAAPERLPDGLIPLWQLAKQDLESHAVPEGGPVQEKSKEGLQTTKAVSQTEREQGQGIQKSIRPSKPRQDPGISTAMESRTPRRDEGLRQVILSRQQGTMEAMQRQSIAVLKDWSSSASKEEIRNDAI